MPKRKDHYCSVMNMNRQTDKCKGSEIKNVDTIRGCPFNCESCYD